MMSRLYHCDLVWEEKERGREREGGKEGGREREGAGRLEVLVYSAVTSHDIGL